MSCRERGRVLARVSPHSMTLPTSVVWMLAGACPRFGFPIGARLSGGRRKAIDRVFWRCSGRIAAQTSPAGIADLGTRTRCLCAIRGWPLWGGLG
jgi:hypothetical protein